MYPNVVYNKSNQSNEILNLSQQLQNPFITTTSTSTTNSSFTQLDLKRKLHRGADLSSNIDFLNHFHRPVINQNNFYANLNTNNLVLNQNFSQNFTEHLIQQSQHSATAFLSQLSAINPAAFNFANSYLNNCLLSLNQSHAEPKLIIDQVC